RAVNTRRPPRRCRVGGKKNESPPPTVGNRRGVCNKPPDLTRPAEIGGTDHDERKHNGDLRVSRRQKRQLFGPLHDLKKIADHVAEAIEQSFPLGGLSREQRDLLGVLAHPDEVETEVGLEPLLAAIKRHQPPPPSLRE